MTLSMHEAGGAKPAKEPCVLIVDDKEVNLRLLRMILGPAGFGVLEASDGNEALSMLKGPLGRSVDVVLSDLMMPGMDGIEFVQAIKASEGLSSIPVIIITASLERESRIKALELGAEDFLTRPIDRHEVIARVRNLSRIKAYQDLLTRYNEELHREVQEKTKQLEQSHLETLVVLAKASEYRDEDTGLHIRRIGEYAQFLSWQMGIKGEFVGHILQAAPMHDVGKIGIPDGILLKPGPLSAEEWEVMKTHTVLGARILKGGSSPYLDMGMRIALGHHERFDGSGYPNGLKGRNIPLEARITQLCDCYDALRSKRPYKPALEHEKTFGILMKGDGRTSPEHFDTEVLLAFERSASVFEEIFENFQDEPYA
jgi:putative two-component system response regulator